MTTTIHIKTDKKIKERADKFAKANGVTLTTFVNLSLKQSLDMGRIILKSNEDTYEPNEKTRKELKKILSDIKTGKNLSPAFSNMDDAFKWLRNKDKNKWK